MLPPTSRPKFRSLGQDRGHCILTPIRQGEAQVSWDQVAALWRPPVVLGDNAALAQVHRQGTAVAFVLPNHTVRTHQATHRAAGNSTASATVFNIKYIKKIISLTWSPHISRSSHIRSEASTNRTQKQRSGREKRGLTQQHTTRKTNTTPQKQTQSHQ